MKYLFVICFLFQIYSTSANAQSYKYHTVKKGETVFSISQTYSIDEEDIYKYNPDAKEGIGINEKLVIPIDASTSQPEAGSSVSFKEHTVKKKETLYSLSKEYDVSVDEIKRYNKQLYSKELQMGETIRIPQGAARSNSMIAENTPKPAPVSKPKESQITKTREHIVLPKETKYGIARKYGMTLKELEAINPRVEELQPGMMIRVGTDVLEDEPVIITDDRFRFYEVKPQETLFSLTRRFGVSIDSLKQLNPALKDGLKFGMVLKVPENPDGKNTDDEDYTGSGELANTKMDLSNSINNRSTKEIVLMLPYHLNKIEEDSIETYRNSIMNERVVRISLDFYSGVLMAIDKAKSMGISTNLKVYDTRQSASDVANVINANDFSNVDAVIGPLLQTPTEAAAARLESKNIPVINPLSNRSMRGYQNLFQSVPTEEFMKNAMLEFISRNSAGKNVIIVADGKAFKIKSELSSILPSARVVTPTDNYVSDAALAGTLTAGKNLVILESDNINVVSSTTSALNRLAREHDITLLTTNKTNAFENDIISNNHLGNLKFHYPSVDKEYDNTATEKFNERYVERFNIEPNRYALRGYDLTLDILLRLASAEDLYDSFERYPGFTEYYESKFHYMPNPEGGFTNDAIYLLKLNKDLTISEANDL
ncbi:amino acid/amide ABC transporter substrate-binding protein (HAAT family) [Christiangramia gaetbulicola]|uniref:Amino acid/amide ABC transporter substrate-binding protein (HAAT family) n=1 Tax=Christiangramia gaetbulicola TaxID=703340 RepID=A0A2T6AF42_9FLAO|nr:LysM peptidoglycan-binding domain-containing protein [Christiangramia gaetbulicola]PTX42419.1 amino acid/amide ABC transporter substrate-binding protein (HAAT family) [Christiangramia gaetbulicola]